MQEKGREEREEMKCSFCFGYVHKSMHVTRQRCKKRTLAVLPGIKSVHKVMGEGRKRRKREWENVEKSENGFWS